MFNSRAASIATKTGIRAFSTPAAAAANHAPPKKLIGTVGRYASALYTAASKAKALEKVEGELAAVGNILQKMPNFAAYLENPTISRGDKVAKVGEVIDEKKFSHITRNLFMTLSANGRIGEARKVIASYDDLMQTSRGVVKAVIISSEPLAKKTLTSLEVAVKNIAGAGKTVEITSQVDESILGGLQVMVGDKFLDLSVKSRLNDLSKTLDGSA